MPRTRLDPKVDPLARLLWGQLKTMHLAPEDLNLPGLSPATLRRRLAKPEDLSLRELRMLSKRLHLPAEEIRAAIHFN